MSNKANEVKLRNYLNSTAMSKKSEQQRVEEMRKLPIPKTVTQADKKLIAGQGKKNPNASKPKRNF